MAKQETKTHDFASTAETPLEFLKGVGPKRATALGDISIKTLADLLYHFPRRYLDRSTITPIVKLHSGEFATVVGKVLSQDFVKTRRRGYFQILLSDDSSAIKCIWFNGAQYMQKVFKSGDMVAMSGKVDLFNGQQQFVHPDYDKLEQKEWDTINTARIIPLYHSTAGLKKLALDSRGFRRVFGNVFEKQNDFLLEMFPEQFLNKMQLLEINKALRQIHFPDSIELLKKARRRFEFEELFFLQLMLGVKRKSIKAVKKQFAYTSTGKLLKKIFEELPFELTEAQKKVVHEIWADMKSGQVMNRLIQGDVGSGKTIVALLCASIAIGNGFQTALMAPTEILAEQHYKNLQKFGKPAGINVVLLVGRQKKKEREHILEEIKNGNAQLIVGTHALIQESVEMKNLSFVIVDEQHRFGVMQRSELISKGLNPDVLVMTATPIPRTMSMTLYGDMDVSIIDQMPANKGKIITRVINQSKISDVYKYVKQQIDKGDQAYIVYPLIEESEKMDLQAAIQGFEYLSTKVFPKCKLALLHGGMKSDEKEKIMDEFGKGTIDILVSTTVIEVGVDNANATIMIIENAERFGLTQLHQLRGRVGRGSKNGVCVLVERKRTETSFKRLGVIKGTINGFEISEEDLKLRGPGEFYSTRQHGFPKMKIADLIYDRKIMERARKEVSVLLKDDPHLRRNMNRHIRKHLIDNYSGYMEFVNVL